MDRNVQHDLNETFLREMFPEKIFRLQLQDNSIRKLEQNVFSDCPELRVLNLTNNEIRDVQHVFAPSLEDLHLQANYITIRNHEPLFNQEMTNLIRMNLNHCNISKLYNETFQNLKALEILYMDFNHLEELPDGIFHNMLNLSTLSLTNNQLKTLPDSLLKTSIKLKHFDLANNELSSLPNELLCHVVDITYVNLVNNSINTSSIYVRLTDTNNELIFKTSTEGHLNCGGNNCRWSSNEKRICNKNNCPIYIGNRSEKCVSGNDEFWFYAWLFFITVILIQVVIFVIFLVIFIRNKRKTE